MFGKRKADPRAVADQTKIAELTKELERTKKELTEATSELRKLRAINEGRRLALWNKVDANLKIGYHHSISENVDDIRNALYETQKVLNNKGTKWITQKIVESTEILARQNADGKVRAEQVILAAELLAKRIQKDKVKVCLN